jgi:hypothetical protein
MRLRRLHTFRSCDKAVLASLCSLEITIVVIIIDTRYVDDAFDLHCKEG